MAKPQMSDPTPIEIDGDVEAPPMPAAAQAGSRIAHQSMIGRMREKFAGEKRVSVKVKNDGPVQVQVNGYSFLIRENVRVEVPESIAVILDEAGYI